MQTTYHARLFASDDDGETHFEDVPVDLERELPIPPTESLHRSIPMKAESVFWIGGPEAWKGDKTHPAVTRMMLVTLKGEYQIQASDGETRKFPVGSVLLLDDVTGAGHSTKILSAGGVVVLAVGLPSLSLPESR